MVLYKNILSLLYDTYFDSKLQAIDHLLMEEFSQLDGLFTELDTAVGQLISEYSVMEGYSNTADEIKERLDDNGREVERLRDLYRYALHHKQSHIISSGWLKMPVFAITPVTRPMVFDN